MHISEFFDELDLHKDQVPIDELVRLMKRLDITCEGLKPHISYCDEHYKRNLIRLGPAYAALVLCWNPGQKSPVHDHTGSACGVRVMTGEVRETRYHRDAAGNLRERDHRHYPVGAVCGSYDSDVHVLANDSETECVVTLHVYTPPLDGFHIYDLETGAVEVCRDLETLRAREELAAHAK